MDNNLLISTGIIKMYSHPSNIYRIEYTIPTTNKQKEILKATEYVHKILKIASALSNSTINAISTRELYDVKLVNGNIKKFKIKMPGLRGHKLYNILNKDAVDLLLTSIKIMDSKNINTSFELTEINKPTLGSCRWIVDSQKFITNKDAPVHVFTPKNHLIYAIQLKTKDFKWWWFHNKDFEPDYKLIYDWLYFIGPAIDGSNVSSKFVACAKRHIEVEIIDKILEVTKKNEDHIKGKITNKLINYTKIKETYQNMCTGSQDYKFLDNNMDVILPEDYKMVYSNNYIPIVVFIILSQNKTVMNLMYINNWWYYADKTPNGFSLRTSLECKYTANKMNKILGKLLRLK